MEGSKIQNTILFYHLYINQDFTISFPERGVPVLCVDTVILAGMYM